MRLRVMLPSETLLDTPASKVVAESDRGSFGLLPRHVDVAVPLVPGILLYEDEEGVERLLAVDQGVLVKCGPEVRVSVRDAVEGDDLAGLRATVRERFEVLDDRERRTRAALAHLEARFIRRFVEQGRWGRVER